MISRMMSPRRVCTHLGLGLLVLAAVLFAAPGSARAQSERDGEFIDILARAGYTDLAEEEARRIEASAKYPTNVRGDAGYALFRILKAKARAASGARAQELLAEATKLIEELKQKYPTHSYSDIADLERLQAKLAEADALLTSAAEAESEAEAAAHNERAVAVFKAVLGDFDAVIDAMNESLEEDYSEDVEFKRDLAEYLRANAYLSYGTALGKLGEGGKKEALERSFELFSRFFDDRGTFFNLWTLSYIGKAKALIELERFDDAEELLSMVGDIEPPGHPDPDIHRQQVQFVKDLRAEGTYWRLKALARAGQGGKAIEVFKRFEQSFPGYLKTHFGKLAVFEYARALAGIERFREAGDAVGVVLKASMQSSNLIPGYDIDRYGVSACKVLAEISERNTGFFPAPLQYRAGQGFFFKGEFEKATYALKGVLASGASDAERALWGPKALLDLGRAYTHNKRPFEAALAYQGLYRMFPEAEASDAAMKWSKQLFEQLAEKDAWFRNLADEVTRDEQELLTGVRAEKSKYNQAVGWQKQGRYVDAARKFLEIEPELHDGSAKTPVPFYGEALANAGYCYFLAAQEASGSSADDYRARALETLDKALDYGKENAQPKAWAAAAYYKSLIAGSESEKRYEEALAALEAFDDELSDQRGYLAQAYGQMVECLVKLDRLNEAERRVEMLRDGFESSAELVSSSLTLGSAFTDAADAAFEAGEPERGKALQLKAGKYVGIWAGRSERMSFGGASWAGNVLYSAGMFDKAKAAFEKAFKIAKAPEDLSEAERQALLFEYTQIRYGLTLVHLGEAAKAVQVLEDVRRRFEAAGREPLKDFELAYGLSNALYAQWRGSPDRELVLRLKEAHEAYWGILRQIEAESWPEFVEQYNLPHEPFFRVRLESDARLLEIALAMKDWGRVKYDVDQLESQGWLDDQIDLADGSWVSCQIKEEKPDGSLVVTVRGEERTIPKDQIKAVDRFPDDLRQRFLELRRRAIEEGRL